MNLSSLTLSWSLAALSVMFLWWQRPIRGTNRLLGNVVCYCYYFVWIRFHSLIHKFSFLSIPAEFTFKGRWKYVEFMICISWSIGTKIDYIKDINDINDYSISNRWVISWLVTDDFLIGRKIFSHGLFITCISQWSCVNRRILLDVTRGICKHTLHFAFPVLFYFTHFYTRYLWRV